MLKKSIALNTILLSTAVKHYFNVLNISYIGEINMYGNQDGFKPRSFAPVNVGDEVEVTIEAVGDKGDGIAKIKGFVLFIPNTKEGDTVNVRISKVLRKVGFADVIGDDSATAKDDSGSEEAPAEESEEATEESEEAPAEEATEESEEAPAEEEKKEETPEDTEDFGEDVAEGK
jgi:predicted RNA-binding protein with TRAM domain